MKKKDERLYLTNEVLEDAQIIFHRIKYSLDCGQDLNDERILFDLSLRILRELKLVPIEESTGLGEMPDRGL